MKSYYPTYLSTFMNLGEAALKLGRGPEAIAAFEEALGINPFHPRVHEALVQLYTAAGNAAAAERSKAALVILQMSSTTTR